MNSSIIVRNCFTVTEKVIQFKRKTVKKRQNVPLELRQNNETSRKKRLNVHGPT